MEPLHFACPHCGLRLRVKDPLSVGRDARCPECIGGFRVEAVHGEYRVLASESAASASGVDAPPHGQKPAHPKQQRSATAADAAAGRPARKQSSTPPWWQRPAIVGVGIIAVCAVAGIASIYRSQTDELPRRETADSPSTANALPSADALPTEPASDTGALPATSDDAEIAAVASDEEPSDVENQGTSSDAVAITPGEGQDMPNDDMAIDTPDDQPLEPEFAEEPVGVRQVNIALSLRQPIRRFELSPARPLRELLPGLEELLGAPIRFDRDEVTDAYLGRGVQLRTENSTVGEILDKLLKEAGLGYEPAADHLRLKPRS